jgi:hypothetical protein
LLTTVIKPEFEGSRLSARDAGTNSKCYRKFSAPGCHIDCLALSFKAETLRFIAVQKCYGGAATTEMNIEVFAGNQGVMLSCLKRTPAPSTHAQKVKEANGYSSQIR